MYPCQITKGNQVTKRMIIVYDDLIGHVMPDGLVEHYVDEVITQFKREDIEQLLIFGNQIPIDYFRLAVKKGKINCNDIVFRFRQDGEDIRINENGRLQRWPGGFCDYIETILSQL